MTSRVAVLSVLLALCFLQTCLTDSSWDYRGAKNKAEALAQATGVAPSSPKAVTAAARSASVATKPSSGSLKNSTRVQGACGDAMFNDWAAAFNYSFSGHSRQAALSKFCSNMEEVKKINANMSVTYWASGNAFSHLSFEEFSQQYLTNLTVKRRTPQPAAKPTNSRKMLVGAAAAAPTKSYVNWVEAGKVTPIRNQAGCSSCWAFTSIAVIESMYLIANGGNASDPALHLSEQQLISCVSNANGYQSRGCSSGLADEAIDYAADHAVVLSSLYPYNASTGTCNSAVTSSPAPGQAVRLSGYHLEFPYNDQTQMIDEAVLIKGVQTAPTVVYFTVDSNFARYAGGIYTPDPASSNNVNHALVLVGFNTTSSSARHWVVRNSWGDKWGEKGYARVRMTGDASSGAGPNGMYQYAYQAPAAFSTPALQLSAPAAQLQSTKQSPKQASR